MKLSQCLSCESRLGHHNLCLVEFHLASFVVRDFGTNCVCVSNQVIQLSGNSKQIAHFQHRIVDQGNHTAPACDTDDRSIKFLKNGEHGLAGESRVAQFKDTNISSKHSMLESGSGSRRCV